MADDIMGKLEALQGGASNVGQNSQSDTDANRQLAHEATVFWKTYAKLKGSWEADPKGATSIRKQKSVVGKAAGKVSKEVQTVKKKMGLLGGILKTVVATAAVGFVAVKSIWEGGRWIFEKIKDLSDNPELKKDLEKHLGQPGKKGGEKLGPEHKQGKPRLPGVFDVTPLRGLEKFFPNSPLFRGQPGAIAGADMTKTEQSIDVSNRYLSEISGSLRDIARGGSAPGGGAPRQARYPSSSNTYTSQPPMGGGGGPGLVSGRMSYWDSANNMNGDGIPQGMV